jgi:hypothetical protein
MSLYVESGCSSWAAPSQVRILLPRPHGQVGSVGCSQNRRAGSPCCCSHAVVARRDLGGAKTRGVTLPSPGVVLFISGVLTEVTLSPWAGRLDGTVILPVPAGARVRISSGQAYWICLPTSRLSLATKTRGGRGRRVVCGLEVGEVEVGLTRLGARGRGGPCLAGLRPAGPSRATLKAEFWGILFT